MEVAKNSAGYHGPEGSASAAFWKRAWFQTSDSRRATTWIFYHRMGAESARRHAWRQRWSKHFILGLINCGSTLAWVLELSCESCGVSEFHKSAS
jgi:hypothetical protein